MFGIHFDQIKSVVLFIAALVGFGTASVSYAYTAESCINFIKAQDYSRAVTEAKALLKRKNLTDMDERHVQICLGRAHYATGRFQDALPALLRAEALSRSTGDLALAYNLLGATYQGMGELDRAELYTLRAIKAFKELDNKVMEAMNLNNLGMIVQVRGDLDRAFELFQDSLALAPDDALKPTKLNNIALIHIKRKEFAEAAKLLREALDLSRHQGDGHKSALIQINLGKTLRNQGDLAGAEQELTAGLNAVQLIGDRGLEAVAFEALASLEIARKDFVATKSWIRKAEQTYRGTGNTAKVAEMRKVLLVLEKEEEK